MSEAKGDKVADELFQIYSEVIEETETKINAFYKKFETENGLNASQARRYIQGNEYTVWRKSMEAYLEDIKGAGANSDVALELNTLAMKSRISREEKLLSELYREVYNLAEMQETELTKCLEDVLQSSYNRTSTCFVENTKIKYEAYKLNEKLVREVLEFPWHTKNFSKSIWDNTDDLCANLKHIISKGFTSGSSVQKMTRELIKTLECGRYEAERLVTTECRFFANKGQLLSFNNNGITRYILKNGNSDNICDKCRMFNNIAIPIDKAEAYVNLPPLHPWCKCFIVPYIENSMFDGNNDVVKLEDTVILSSDEERALKRYISSDSYKINDKLRRGAELSDDDKKFIQDLDAALDKMPNYTDTAYRSISDFGIEDINEFFNSYVVGDKTMFRAYTSTSESVYDSGLPIQFVIESKTGKDIRKYNKGEKEILYKRDTRFLVKEVKGNTIHLEEE